MDLVEQVELSGDDGSSAPLLGAVLDTLGLDVVEIVVAPRGLDVPIGELVIHDTEDDLLLHQDDLLLAVGVDGTRPEAVELVRRAGAQGAAAVAVKRRGSLPDELAAAAHQADVALLGVPPEIAWAQLHSLLRVATASHSLAQNETDDLPVGDLCALANAVAVMVGGATTIESRQSQILAYSNLDEPIDESRRQTILGRRVPQEWVARLEREGVFKRLWNSDDVILVDIGSDDAGNRIRPRLAVAVKAGDEVLGSIWVSEGRRPFSPEAERALREAGRIAALHLLRHQAGEDLERRRRSELLRLALEGRLPAEVLPSTIGVPATGHMAVVAFELRTADPAAVVSQTGRLVNLISVYCEAYRRQAASVAIGPVVYLLLSLPDRGRTEARTLAADILERTREALPTRLRAGVGSTVEGVREVASSRWEADQALRILAAVDGDRDLAHIDDVRTHAVLLELRDVAEQHPRLRSGKYHALVDYDRKHGTAYVHTLRTYLDAFGDARAAAEAINVHPNTLRYRIRRAEELTGLDLDDPVERLVTQLQLHLARDE